MGSVNAARDHYQSAINDLEQAQLLWSGQIEKLITNRYPYSNFQDAFAHHGQDEIKVVLDWTQ